MSLLCCAWLRLVQIFRKNDSNLATSFRSLQVSLIIAVGNEKLIAYLISQHGLNE